MKEAKIFERHMVTGQDNHMSGDPPPITVIQYVLRGEEPEPEPRDELHIELHADGTLELIIENGYYTGTLKELEEKLIEWATGEYCDPDREVIVFTNKGETPVNSWKPEVKLGDDEWGDNALRFATEKEAKEAGRELMSRWMVVQDYRATPTADPVNYRFNFDRGRPERIEEESLSLDEDARVFKSFVRLPEDASIRQVQVWIENLIEEDLLWHFDDDVADCHSHLNSEQVEVLKSNRNIAYSDSIDWGDDVCPIGYSLKIIESNKFTVGNLIEELQQIDSSTKVETLKIKAGEYTIG